MNLTITTEPIYIPWAEDTLMPDLEMFIDQAFIAQGAPDDKGLVRLTLTLDPSEPETADAVLDVLTDLAVSIDVRATPNP